MPSCFACFGLHKRQLSEDVAAVIGSSIARQTSSYTAVRREEESNVNLHNEQASEEEMLARGLNEPCVVCCDGVATHVSVSCGHSACEACWETWQASSSNKCCMLCGGISSGVLRADFSICPKTTSEKAAEARGGGAERAHWAVLHLQAEKVDRAMQEVKTHILP